MSFAQELKQARIDARLTQQQVADLTQIPKRTIEAWEMEGENGRAPAPWCQRLVIEEIKRLKGHVPERTWITEITDEVYSAMKAEAEAATSRGRTYNALEMLDALERLDIALNQNSFCAVERLAAEGYVNPVNN